jgi:uroporphyrinogen-III synthase
VEILERRGAMVAVLPIYRTVAAELDATVIEEIRRGVDAVLFTSGSTVKHFMHSLRQYVPGAVFPEHTRIVCIGPVTASAARETGLRVDSVAQVHTTEGLVDSVLGVFLKGAVVRAE